MSNRRLASPQPGSYAVVNGLHMYYETHGAGKPLVLLHGGLTTIDSSFGAILPALAKTRKVVAVEQQAHGRTADVDRPLTFEQMADDTAALLRQLEMEGADFFGYSDGGNVALGIAVRHPELVHKLIVAGTNYNKEGLYPEIVEGLAHAAPDDMPSILREEYERIAPNPDNWPALIAKVVKLTMEFRGWRTEELRSIQAPTLVIVGDSDIVRTEHAVQLFRLLPYGQLAVFPDTDHWVLGRTGWLLSMMELFLDPSEQTKYRIG